MGRAALTWTLFVAACVAVLCVAAAPAGAFTPPFRPMNPQAYALAKAQADDRAGVGGPLAPLTAPVMPAGPKAKVVSGLNQPGLAHGDNSAANDGTPPDPTGAIGPNDYIEFVNSVVRLYNRDLTTVADTQQLDDFVGHHGDTVFDPQIEYDPVAQRWFYLSDDCAASSCATQNFLDFGFSKSNDPSNMTSDWCTYRIRTDNAGGTGLFDDYPKLGHNDTNLIFGTNVFDASGNFVSARVWTVLKPNAGLATPIVTCPLQSTMTTHWYSGTAASPVQDGTLSSHPLLTSTGAQAFTPVPANTQDSSSNGYVVAAGDPPGNTIMAWHVTSTGTLAADGNISVSSFGVPAAVPQPGTTDVLDSSDTRLTQAVAHADPDAGGAEAVWTQHTISGSGGRSVDRWYELIPSTKTKRQEGAISDPTSFVFNGSISPTMAGNEAMIEYNVGGSSQLAQIRAQSRVGTRTLGTMGGEVTLGTSTHFDQDFSCPSNNPGDPTVTSCRWGDYSAATPDPGTNTGDNHVVWGTNQLLGDPVLGDPSAPHWTTRNFALSADGGPVASFTVTPNPAFAKKAVSFDASTSTDSDGGNMSFEWDFGNGTFVPGGAQVTHSYDTPGMYTVRVRVSDDKGGTPDVATQTLTINSAAPTASFTESPTTTTRAASVVFDASASHDAEGPGGIATYAWDFDGNGTIDQTTTSPTVSHAYGVLGTFTPRLTVTDADDGLSSAPAAGPPVTVVNAPPVARISAVPAHPAAGSPATLDGSASTDADGTIVDYSWDLNGDGSYETDTRMSPHATTTFKTTGAHPVSLRVRDSDGATAIATTTVVVAPKLNLSLSFGRTTRLTTLLKRGLSGRVGCGEACTVRVTLSISKPVARKHRTKTTIAKLTVKLTGSSKRALRLRLARGARRALGQAAPFTITLRAVATDGVRNTKSAKRTLRVKR